MKNVLIVVVFTSLVVFLGWWLGDETLDPEAQRWLDLQEAPGPSYLYLLGLDADKGADPEQLGRQRMNAPDDDRILFRPDAYPELMAASLLCEYASADCLLSQQNDAHKARALLQRYGFLLARYQRFLSFGEFSGSTSLDIHHQHYPPYDLLAQLARLQSLAWSLNDQGGVGLGEEIEQLRQLMAEQHNMISKLVIARILGEKIQLAALLMQQGKTVPVTRYRLSREEKSLRKALASEFRWATSQLDVNWLSDAQTGMPWYEGIQYLVGLRKHIMTNRAFALFRHYAALSENPAAIIADDDYQLPPPTLAQRLRNPAGNEVLEKAFPQIPDYLMRLAHLDARLQLLSWFRHPDMSLPNPWSPGLTESVVLGEEEVCFANDYNTGNHRSCLPLLAGKTAP